MPLTIAERLISGVWLIPIILFGVAVVSAFNSGEE
jgi:hypothetical protein